MTETHQDFDREAGDDFVIRDTVTDEDDDSAEFRDLTDHDGVFTLARYKGGAVLEQFDDTEADFEVTDAANGEVEIFVDGTLTEDHGGRTLYYEIEFTSPDGHDQTVTWGEIAIGPSY